MAIAHLCGFATFLVTGDYLTLTNPSLGTPTYTRVANRSGGYALRHVNSSNSGSNTAAAVINVPPMNAFSIGCALKHSSSASVSGGDVIGLSITAVGSTRIALPGGAAVVGVAASGTSAWNIIDMTPTSLGWHWWNFAFNLSGTVGYFRVYRDGVLIAEQAADTLPTGATNVTVIALAIGNQNTGAASSGVDIADLIVRNDTTLIADSRVDVLLPNGNGASSDWVGSDGNSTDNYLLVDEAPTIDAGDYVAATTAAATDLYAFTDLPYTPISIDAVQVSAVATKTDAGAKTMCTMVNGGEGTAVDTGGAKTVYGLWTTNPSGGAAWDKTAVDALTAGVRVKT